ncbi:MAG: PH domain-containing protein [Acidimicrobiia bacterium]
MAKKIRKSCASDLLPGEDIVAGTFGQPLGAFKKQVAFGAVGGLIGSMAGEKLSKGDRAKNPVAIENSVASTIPEGKAVIGVTNQRLLFFGHSTMSGKPTDLKAAIPFNDVHRFDANHGKLKSEMTVTFADGSARAFEVVKAGKPGQFSEAMETALAVR